MATPRATDNYRDQFSKRYGRTYFRRFDDLVVSSIGIGTYLGDPSDAVDERYRSALVEALESGCNVIDTAINYRHQRSERTVGQALTEATVDRDAVVVATKGGFLPFDGERPSDPGDYVQTEYLSTGIVDRDDLARGSHCIAPDFIDDQFDRSRSNLGVETIDCYYVHNPETQLEHRSAAAVYDQLEATFGRLERRIADGTLGRYGVATWDAFRVSPSDEAALSLPEVVSRARAAADAAGNDTTGFRAVQLPFNVVMADAFTVEAHDGPDGKQSALAFIKDAGLSAFTSASLGQGRLVQGLPPAIDERLPGDTPAQRAINFARSAPGVTCALVGASRQDHVTADLAAGSFDAMGADAFDATFE